MDPDFERKLYFEGIELFNSHEFFEAHEAWEDVWRLASGAKQSFYQGLIQCAVALEHYRRSNPRGVVSVYQSYLTKFARLPPGPFMGLDVRAFLEQMRETLTPVIDAKALPERGAISLDLTRVPRIALMYDPFETGEAARLDR